MTARYKAHNLLSDPKPTGLRGWNRFGDVEVSMTADGTGISCRNLSGGIDYVSAKYAGTGMQYAVGFTCPEENTAHKVDIILRVPLPTDGKSSCRWARVGMFTAADWEAMQEAGVEWFDGDSTVPGVGLPLSGLYPHVDRRIALVVVA